MVLLLAEQLEVPFRERNHLLLAAGHAPAFPERSLEDPELAPVREALDLILTGHEPYPAVVVDRGWNLVAANSAMAAMAAWVDPALLEPPVNVMRAGLHPRGLARWTVNLGEVRAYFLGRLERQVAISGDADLAALLEEVAGLSRTRVRAPPGRRGGCRAYSHAADADAWSGGSGAVVLRDGGDVRHGGRGDDLRAFDRVDVPRRCGDRRGAAEPTSEVIDSTTFPWDDVTGQSKRR